MIGKLLAPGGRGREWTKSQHQQQNEERKLTRKEMTQRAKNLPYLIGLELVACQVFGSDFGDDRAKHIFLSSFNTDSKRDEKNVQDVDSVLTAEHITATPIVEIEPMDAGCCDEPLNLSTPSSPPSHHPSVSLDLMTSADGTQLSIPVLQNELTPVKRKGSQVKRTYTEEVLAAAVRDVKAGKLGTRRAAAIYGVPRSTLRNKVFRDNPNRRPAAAATATVTGSLKQSADGATRATPLTFWDLKLAEVRRKHDLQAGFSRPFGMPPLFYNNECLMECERAFSLADPFTYDTKIPDLRQFVAKVTRQMLDQQHHHDQSTSIEDDIGEHCRSLRNPVASFNNRPSTSLKNKNETSSFSNTLLLKPLLANKLLPARAANVTKLSLPISVTKSDIAEKAVANNVRKQKENNVTHDKCRQTTKPSDMNANNYVIMTSPEVARRATRSANVKASKHVRAKRGQYRRYKMELLMEAVKAVQRGEMSVHRAGSYYGVPHSTLEYKVKERHLLRQKKLAAAKAVSDNTVSASDVDETTSSTQQNAPILCKELNFGSSNNYINDTNSNTGTTSTCDESDEGNNTQLSGEDQSSCQSAIIGHDNLDSFKTTDDQEENRSIISMDKIVASSMMDMASYLFMTTGSRSNPFSFPPHPSHHHHSSAAASSLLSNFSCFPWSPLMSMSLSPASFYPPPPPPDAGRSLFMGSSAAPLHGMFASELLKSFQVKANSLDMTSFGSSNAD